MDYNNILKQIENELIFPINDKNKKDSFLKLIKTLKKEIISNEFKLKRTLRDKQITTNVLQCTISELEKKSQYLEEQKALTEEQVLFKEQLFANVSHELRTPIHGILGMSHLLANTILEKEQKDYVQIVRNSADNLLVIINDLLNLSKINAGKTIIRHSPFSINHLCQDLKGVLELNAKKKGLNLMVIYPPNLPQFLTGDRTRLYQLLLNLLNNSVKFTQKGYVSLNIQILSSTKENIELLFEVQDTGVGIEKDKIETIFESFTQIDNKTSDISGGVGLGLNIVKKITSMLNGNLQVESTPNVGTKFSVTIPFKISDKASIQLLQDKQTKISIPAEWKSKNFLLIEDNQANIVYAQNMFLDWNLELDIAKTVKEAQEKVSYKYYHCILSDVKLPDGNGIDFIAQMRSDNSCFNQHSPIIVLTASANEKEKENAKRLNIKNYIGKPFPPNLLINAIQEIFSDALEDKKCDLHIIKKKKVNKKEEVKYFQNLNKTFSGKPKIQIEMFDIFLNQIPIVFEKLETSLAEDNLKLFQYHSHTIKSTINIIGLPQLQTIIHKMDKYSNEEKNLNELPKLLSEFKRQGKKDIYKVIQQKEILMVG